MKYKHINRPTQHSETHYYCHDNNTKSVEKSHCSPLLLDVLYLQV